MFTGIIRGIGIIKSVTKFSGAARIKVELPLDSEVDLGLGASVSIDGVCLTVVQREGRIADFDIMLETLNRTSLGGLVQGGFVNIERAARDNEEIGGHAISGHIDCLAKIIGIDTPENNYVITLQVESQWRRYIFSKGYIALNGASLTVSNVNKTENTFEVWLIPETLRLTTFGSKQVGDLINLEVERGTQVMVDTMRDFLEERLGRRLPLFEEALKNVGTSTDQIIGDQTTRGILGKSV